MIAPAELRSEAQRLADLRSAQGLSALVVDLGDVMDVFADGVYDPRGHPELPRPCGPLLAGAAPLRGARRQGHL